MFKVSRLTDYGVVLLHYLIKGRNKGFKKLSARQLANASKLPLPTVSKLLKLLKSHNIVRASRGLEGGYELAVEPKDVNLLRLIEVFEGSQGITSCISDSDNSCKIPHSCPQRNMWDVVNQKIKNLLLNISLDDLVTKTSEEPHVKRVD